MFEKVMTWVFGKKKIEVTFHLKSGTKTTFRCTDFKINHTGRGLDTYNISGIDTSKKDPIFWVSLPEIELITLNHIGRRR